MTTISNEKKSFFSSTKLLVSYLTVSILATIFDAWSSYQIIVVSPIAIEGNPIWSGAADTLGFAMTMVLRAVVGITLLLSLFVLANQTRHLKARTYARFGLRLAAVVFAILSVYHVLGTFLFTR